MDQSLDAIISGQDSAGAGAGPSSTNSDGSNSGQRDGQNSPRDGDGGRPARRRPRGGRNRNNKRVGSESRTPLASSRGGNRGDGRTVVVKNLHRDIYSDDLRDLFREVGPVSLVTIEEDTQGHRTGLAWVQYEYASDAAVASGRYDGRRAKGQVLTVHQVSDVGYTRPLYQGGLGDRIGVRRDGRRDDRRNARDQSRGNTQRRDSQSGEPKGGRKGGRKGRAPVKQKTAEELDAELDAYMRDGNDPTENSEPGAQTPAAAASYGQLNTASADAAPAAPAVSAPAVSVPPAAPAAAASTAPVEDFMIE